jgi:hypothetical protein
VIDRADLTIIQIGGEKLKLEGASFGLVPVETERK